MYVRIYTHTHTHTHSNMFLHKKKAATSWTATKLLTYVCSLAVDKHQVILLQIAVRHEGLTYPCTLAAVKHVVIHYFSANDFHISICGC
jgi:hypothetical protein